MSRLNRREFLIGCSAASFMGLSGCSMLGSEEEPTKNSTEEEPTEKEEPDATDEPEFKNIYSTSLRNISSGSRFEFITLEHIESVQSREKFGDEIHIRVQLTEEGQEFVRDQYEESNASENFSDMEVEYLFKGQQIDNKLLQTSPHTRPNETGEEWNGEDVLVVSTSDQADEVEANV